MRVAYVEMIGGAAGDMLMGAWVDAGLDVAELERSLRTVVAGGWELVTEKVTRQGIAATHLDLIIPGEDDHAHGPPNNGHPHSHDSGHGHDHGHGSHAAHEHAGHRLRDILAIVERSGMTLHQIERARAIYRRLAQAESRVHGTSLDEVYFHEVGQIDAILDVAGTCIALDLLGIDEVFCSAFPMGHGVAKMAHGIYPNPGPATLELLRGAPLRAVDVEAELVTTTGAAILSTLVRAPGQRVDMSLERIGYGAGRRSFAIPNVVRVSIGTRTETRIAGLGAAPADDDVTVLECNLDDMSPQHFELALERLSAAGALDVWLTPIHMKKGRPAITLSAIAPPASSDAVARAMLRETSTIGVRMREERRIVLPREIVLMDTPLGPVRAKRVAASGIARLQPEYDDVVRIARERDLPIAEVVRVVGTAAHVGVPS